MKRICLILIAAGLTAWYFPTSADAYGGAHAGYTHVGANGAYHVGRTETGGYGGGYHADAYRGDAYGGAYRAGGAYNGAYRGAAGYAGGYRYGAAGPVAVGGAVAPVGPIPLTGIYQYSPSSYGGAGVSAPGLAATFP